MEYPETSIGNLTSGGSIANLVAIVTAREAYDIKARDFDKSVIYLSNQAHHSIQKAIRIAGLSEAHLRYIPLDEGLRLSVKDLEKAPLYIDDTAGLSPTEVRSRSRRVAREIKEDFGMIMIDYLQLMTAGGDRKGGGGNREQEISMISRSLKSIAKELSVPVIALL